MIKILDATLREGEQTPGVFFDGHIKLAIADLLDEIGIDIIEAGHPLVTQEIHDAVQQLAHRNLRAVVGAHARSVMYDIDLALQCDVGFLGIFYCISEDRLNHVFKKDLSQAIDQISKVIRYAREKKPSLLIRYTPEDTVRSKFENVVEVSAAAVDAGANIISIADTTGYMIPGTSRNMYDYVRKLKDELALRDKYPQIAVHCHNDRGLALANALDAYRGGAEIIDTTILGLGERAGIVDLAQLLVALTQDFGVENRWKTEKLLDLYNLVSKHANFEIPHNFPVMGRNAFTHCAGVHTHAAIQNPVHYQSLDPRVVGRSMDVALDHMSGLSSIEWALNKLNIEADDELITQILNTVKSIGQKGRMVELSELPHIVDWCKKHLKIKR